LKLKKLHIITLAIGFCLFMIVSLSETFLTDFSNIRRELFLSANKTEKIIVSENFWKNQSDKNEILINGNYFDVKSVNHIQNKVIIEVVHDKFELTFKKISENLNKKHKLLKTKKNIEILPSKEFQFAFKSSKILSKNNFFSPTILKNKIVIPLFHPPTFI
jgi:hypothetical protein